MLRAVESWHAAQERRVSFSNEFTATAQMKKKKLIFLSNKEIQSRNHYHDLFRDIAHSLKKQSFPNNLTTKYLQSLSVLYARDSQNVG